MSVKLKSLWVSLCPIERFDLYAVMSMPQLMGFVLYPSPHVGEIRDIWSFWGPFLLFPFKNGPISNDCREKYVLCVGLVMS